MSNREVIKKLWKMIIVMFSVALLGPLVRGGCEYRGESAAGVSWARPGWLRGYWEHGSPSERHSPTDEAPVFVVRQGGVLSLKDTLPEYASAGFVARLVEGRNSFGEFVWRGTYSMGVLDPVDGFPGRYELDSDSYVWGIVEFDENLIGEFTQVGMGIRKYDPNPHDFQRLLEERQRNPKPWAGVLNSRIILR